MGTEIVRDVAQCIIGVICNQTMETLFSAESNYFLMMIFNALRNLDVEADEGQADAVRHADGRQEPDLGRRGALVLDVADDLLRRLALVALALHPLVQPGLLQGAVEEDEELDVPVEAGLGQGRQVAQHVVPLPAAHPVRVEAAVEPVQAVVGVDEEAQRGLGGPLAAPTHEAAPRQLLQLNGHYGAGAVLLDVVLESLHSHGRKLVQSICHQEPGCQHPWSQGSTAELSTASSCPATNTTLPPQREESERKSIRGNKVLPELI